MPNTKTDEKGNLVVTLSDFTTVEIRTPKGKDMIALEKFIKSQEETTTTELVIFLIELLSDVPKDVLLETDAEDIQELGEAISTFRAFSKFTKK